VPDKEGWYYIEDLSSSDDEFITPLQRRGVNKALERDQIKVQLGENVDNEPWDHGRVLRVRK
jgi:hypothetical protein